MNYPTIDEVEAATTEQLAEWYRFLKSPGMSAVDRDEPPTMVEFQQVLQKETVILNRIVERLVMNGGMTPELSRHIDWKSR